MFGPIQLVINTNTHEVEKSKLSGKGAWGISTGSFSRFLRLQGILLIQERWHDNLLMLKIAFIENVHLKSNLTKTFRKIPSPINDDTFVDLSEFKVLNLIP